MKMIYNLGGKWSWDSMSYYGDIHKRVIRTVLFRYTESRPNKTRDSHTVDYKEAIGHGKLSIIHEVAKVGCRIHIVWSVL